MRSEVCDDVRGARRLRTEPPAPGAHEHVVAEIPAVHEPQLAELSGRHSRVHALDEGIPADVVTRGADDARG